MKAESQLNLDLETAQVAYQQALRSFAENKLLQEPVERAAGEVRRIEAEIRFANEVRRAQIDSDRELAAEQKAARCRAVAGEAIGKIEARRRNFSQLLLKIDELGKLYRNFEALGLECNKSFRDSDPEHAMLLMRTAYPQSTTDIMLGIRLSTAGLRSLALETFDGVGHEEMAQSNQLLTEFDRNCRASIEALRQLARND